VFADHAGGGRWYRVVGAVVVVLAVIGTGGWLVCMAAVLRVLWDWEGVFVAFAVVGVVVGGLEVGAEGVGRFVVLLLWIVVVDDYEAVAVAGGGGVRRGGVHYFVLV